MKRTLCACLALLLMLPLAACGEESRQVRGLVTEVKTGEDGALTAFVVRTQGGEPMGVLLTGDTLAVPPRSGSWTSSEMRVEFQEALEPDIQISAACLRPKKTLTTQDGQKIAAYQADTVYITGRLNRGAVALADGTVLDVLEDYFSSTNRTYLLPDGAELLLVRGPSGPEHHYVGGLESFDDLSEPAKEEVLAFYEARGALFDEGAELEKAYSDWKAKREDFRCHMVEQDVSPSASSRRVMYFGTHVTLPLDHGDSCTSYTLSLGDAFDRETGEHLELWDLFCCSEAEARRAIIDAALDWSENDELRAEVESAFFPERVIVGNDGLSMDYEPGSMPSQEHGYFFSADLSKLKDLMYDWAVPGPTE